MEPLAQGASRVTGAAGADRTPKGAILLLCMLIGVITFVTFLPALEGGFTNWDDDTQIVDNAVIRHCTIHNLVQVATSGTGYVQPLTMITFMAEYRFFGLNPHVFHFTSVLFHCLNALLVFWLITILSRRIFIGLLVSLLFALSPLRVESVAWATEWKDILSSFFFLLSLIFYVNYHPEDRRRWYLGSIAALVLSLSCKPMAVSQPLVLLLIDYLHRTKISRNLALEKIPFFAIAFAAAVLAIITQRQSGAIAGNPYLSFVQRACLPFYGMLFYPLKTLVPLHLSALYPIPVHPDRLFLLQLYLAPFIAAGFLAAVFRKRKSRTLVFGTLFYLVTLLPVMQIVLIGDFLVADRYSYLPMTGLCYLFAAGALYVIEEKRHAHKKAGVALKACLMVLLAAYAFASFQRCRIWNDSLTLWNDVIARHPGAIAYINRGCACAAASDYGRALDDFTLALRLDPGYAPGYYNRGLVYSSLGDTGRALEDYSRAIVLDPGMAKAYNDRGLIFAEGHDLDRAAGDYHQAIMHDPAAGEPHYNLGIIYSARHEYDSALAEYSRALTLNPAISDAYNDRALVYCYKGEYGRAVEDFGRFLALNPGRAVTWFNRGHAFAAMGDDRRAEDDFSRACSLGLVEGCRALQGRY